MERYIRRDTHVKYQSSSTLSSKVISKVNVFKKWVKLQGQGHRVKNNGTHGKVLSQGILMWNIKALAFTVQKLLARLKFQREWQNDRQLGQKQYAPRSLISVTELQLHVMFIYVYLIIILYCNSYKWRAYHSTATVVAQSVRASARKRKVGCSNPSRHRPKSLQ